VPAGKLERTFFPCMEGIQTQSLVPVIRQHGVFRARNFRKKFMRRSDGQMYFDGFKLECFSTNSCHMQLSSALAWQSLKFGVAQRTDRWFKYSEADVGVLPALSTRVHLVHRGRGGRSTDVDDFCGISNSWSNCSPLRHRRY
jgi:hypothetical protein